MSSLHIPVKRVEEMPVNPFVSTSWPGPGFYLAPGGVVYAVGSAVMLLPPDLARLLREEKPAESGGRDDSFLLKLVAVAQRPELARDLT